MGYLFELFIHLVSQELKLLYKRSWLGIGWTLLNPVIQLIIFSLIFARILAIDIQPYPLFLCCGLLCWNAFSETLSLAASSIINCPSVLYQPGFPPLMLPVVAVMTGLIHFVFSLSILAVLMIWFGVSPGWPLLSLPVLILVQGLLTLALAIPLAALHVSYHDVKHLLSVVFRFMFFLTPILYAANSIPYVPRFFYAANPLTHLIEAYRSIIMDGIWPNWPPLLGVVMASLIVLFLGYRFFAAQRFRFIENL